jgi:hypothetical protein
VPWALAYAEEEQYVQMEREQGMIRGANEVCLLFFSYFFLLPMCGLLEFKFAAKYLPGNANPFVLIHLLRCLHRVLTLRMKNLLANQLCKRPFS